MGYETDYTLTVKPTMTDVKHTLFKSQLENTSSYEFDEDTNNALALYGCKWYDHEDHMKSISKLYPKVLFTLHGEGEDEYDRWNKYFKNGKMQACIGEVTIIYDKYDKKKLR